MLAIAAYLDADDLAHFADLQKHNEKLRERFSAFYGAAFEPGELTKREKLLIGFAVAQTERCPYRIDSFTQQCLAARLTMRHLAEAMHAAAALRAGITLAHGLVAHNVDKKLSM